jgi:hypothetical protein
MSNQIILKKSSVSAKVPLTDDLEYGEVALNYTDGNLYFKDSSNAIKHFADSSQTPVLNILEDTETLPSTASSQVVDTYDKTIYRTVKYLLQAISGSEVHATEITLTHNDDSVFIMEYGIIYTGPSPLITVDADIDSTNVYLKVTPVNADTTIDFTRISIIARVLSGGVEGDLMLQSGSEDLMSGSGSIDLNS